MIKRDTMKEIENRLKLVREEVAEGIMYKSPQRAFSIINKELKGLVGLDIDTIDTLSFNSIKDIISRENEYNAEKYIALGELLRLNGNLFISVLDNIQGIYYYKKAVMYFCQALEEDETLAVGFVLNIEIIVEELNKYELTIDEKIIIFRTYELLGKYDKAEDTLFYILKQSKNDKDIVQLGIEFYNRLENLLEDSLIKGNLPVDEIKEGINKLKKY